MGADGIAEQEFVFGAVRRVCGVDDLDRCLTDQDAVLNSWRPGINFQSAGPGTGAQGLRRAQIGALHTVLAHWVDGDRRTRHRRVRLLTFSESNGACAVQRAIRSGKLQAKKTSELGKWAAEAVRA